MTRLKGKVISRSLTKVPQEGDQVINYYDKIVKVLRVDPPAKDGIRIYYGNGMLDFNLMEYIKELVVEYKIYNNGMPSIANGTTIIPLKYSQWQAAFDNGEVDCKHKEIEFEDLRIYPGGGSGLANCKHVAKIIPTDKPKLYSKEDVRKEMYKVWYHLTMMYAPDTNDFKMQRQFDDWYNSL